MIPHAKDMPFNWALCYGKCPRSFVLAIKRNRTVASVVSVYIAVDLITLDYS